MKTITASAQPGLKLALHVTSNNEYSVTPEAAYFEITPAFAQAVLRLVEMVGRFRAMGQKAGLLDPLYAVSVGLGERLPCFRLLLIPFANGQAPDADRPVVALPEDFDPEVLETEHEYRVECHRIEVTDRDVRFTALAKRSGDKFTTTELSRDLLEKAAAEQSIAVPQATLSEVDY